MAPPTPPAAGATPKGLLKKIPPWGWAIGAGGVLGIGYSLFRSRRDPTAIDAAPAGEADLAYEDYTLSAQPSPGGAYYPSPGVVDVSAETVGAVGQTALETVVGGITGVVESLPALIASAPTPEPSEWGPEGIASIIAAMPQAPAPQAAPISAPKKPPAAKPPTGVTILGRKFPNATGYTERKNAGIGRTFDVQFPGRVERWETWDAEVRTRKVKKGKKTVTEKYTAQIQRKWKKISTRNN
jgi:hypothetical protein